MQNPIVGIDRRFEDAPVLFVLINPFWQNFEENFAASKKACSGSNPKIRDRFANYWYGQPIDYKPIEILLQMLQDQYRP